jgi:hypothetical protein
LNLEPFELNPVVFADLLAYKKAITPLPPHHIIQPCKSQQRLTQSLKLWQS